MSRTSPLTTLAPTATLIFRIFPGIGASMTLAPAGIAAGAGAGVGAGAATGAGCGAATGAAAGTTAGAGCATGA